MSTGSPIRLPITGRRPEVGPPVIVPPTPATPGTVLRGVKLAVIDSVDNAQFPQYATVLIDNHTPGEMGYAIPQGAGPFAAGGTTGYSYYYNNSSGVGGSYCYVDCDNRVIVNFTGGVSTTAPTPFYKALADHNHNGQLDPDQFMNPQPVNLSNGEISSVLPYGNNSPQVQSVISSDGALLCTLFPGQMRLISSGSYNGFCQLINQSNGIQKAQMHQPIHTITGTKMVMNWNVLSWPGFNLINPSSYLDGWGPAIFDSQGNYIWWQFFGVSDGGSGQIESEVVSYTSNDVQTFNGPTLDTTSKGLVHDNNIHYLSLAMTSYTDGTQPYVALYIDGTFRDAGGSSTAWMTGPFYPGFIIRGSQYPTWGFYIQSFSVTTSVPHEQMSDAYQTNYDNVGNAATTRQFVAKTANMQPYVTDFQLHYTVSATTPYVITYYYDNGTAGTDSFIYVTHDTSGNSDLNLGHTTSGSPSGTYNTGLSSSGTVYVMAYFDLSAQRLNWTWQTTPFTGAQIRTAYSDGYAALFASLNVSGSNSSAIPVSSGGSGSRTGNGGKTTL